MASVRTRVNIPVGENHKYLAEFVTFEGLSDAEEHVALVFKGADKDERPLVRIHSECLTGDVFQSARCDCGKQLDEAVESMGESGGVILYLRQEGRGIGLYNKMDAYKLQDQGFDTYEANRQLGFDHDLRDFTAAAQMLEAMDVKKIQLLTNNPKKINAIKDKGIDVESVGTGVYSNQHNEGYLKAKVQVAHHVIDLDKIEDLDK